MHTWFANLMIAFIPIFVAMDAVGVLPSYIALIEGLSKEQRKRILFDATLTAFIIGLVFVFLGRKVFSFLGITVADFMVAGGLVLLILSISELLFSQKDKQVYTGAIGVVPLGMPLIVGPATLTTLVVQVDLVGASATLIAFLLNLIVTYLVFLSAIPILKILGQSGAQAVAKVANLLMAAIAVMLIRKGFIEIIG